MGLDYNNNGIKVVYGELDPLDNWKCGVKTEDFELPLPAKNKNTDPNCCIDFDVKGKKHVFCST